jgi:hypothetical protein
VPRRVLMVWPQAISRRADALCFGQAALPTLTVGGSYPRLCSSWRAAARAIRAARARGDPVIRAVIEMRNAAFSAGHDSAPGGLSRCDKQGTTLDFGHYSFYGRR